MSRKLVSLAALIVLIGTLSIVLQVQMRARKADGSRVAGVSIGDWWGYDLNFTWVTTSNSNPWCDLLNNTDWMRCTVLDVSGTNVTFQLLYHLKNGTERDVIGLIDVATGHSNASSSFMINPYIIISANLTPGDPIYTEQYYYWKINATVSRTYVETTIQTNLLNISTYNDLIILYYDKNTGILCESEISSTTQYGYYYLHSLVVESPIIPELSSFLIPPLFIIATLLAVIVPKRKRARKMTSSLEYVRK